MRHRRIPRRTCVGCRGCCEQAGLLRVVAVGPKMSERGPVTLSPDPAQRAGGRGAYVHRDMACVESALRRRAFGRALRINGRVEAEQLVLWMEQHYA